VDSGEVARLGGVRKQLAILFSDIQNFTTLSEEMDAELLMQHLSEYLEVVSQILTAESATIDKYIGDAVMAFWGAPNEDARPTERACISALRCQQAIAKMNEKWIQEGKPPLPTRFGVHVGTTVVGNIGSADRMNYTIIGDSVNFAARLEAVNKRYGTWTLVSDDVIEEVGNVFLTRPIDIVAVKGKTKGVGIHELIATRQGPLAASDEEIQLCEQTATAFGLYLSRRWEEALLVLETISQRWPEDQVTDMMIRRCRAFLVEPPPEDWTGVMVLKEK
jgi:adenylate cyclase